MRCARFIAAANILEHFDPFLASTPYSSSLHKETEGQNGDYDQYCDLNPIR